MDVRVRTGVATRRHVSLHFIADEGVLFDASAQRIHAINNTAALIWCCLEEELPPARIAERLRETTGLAKSEAVSYVNEIISRWRELRLVADPMAAYELRPTHEVAKRPPAHPSRKSRPRDRAAAERDIQLLDSSFRIRFFSESLLAQTAPFLAPLARPERAKDPAILDLLLERENYALYEGSRRIGHAERLDQVVPMLKASLVPLLLERSADFCAVHAAAVARNGRCVLIPGPAGAGKSTLAAAALSHGFGLLGDDTIVLANDTLAARPVPLAICLKQGACELLADRYPGLARQPVHERLDAKRVRYLIPPRENTCADPAVQYPVRAIAFPNRRPGAAAALVPVTRSDALSRLFKYFYPIADGLNANKIERLLAWIAPVDCYELQFSTLDDATLLVTGLCP